MLDYVGAVSSSAVISTDVDECRVGTGEHMCVGADSLSYYPIDTMIRTYSIK